MGSTTSQGTDWCCQQVQLSREPSLRNVQLKQSKKLIERTLKKVNNKAQYKRSDENSLGELNSSFSHNTQFFNMVDVMDLDKSQTCRCKTQRLIKPSVQAQSIKLQNPSSTNKGSNPSINANQTQTQNRELSSELLSGKNTNRSQNSQHSLEIQATLNASVNKHQSRIQSNPSMIILKRFRSISIEVPHSKVHIKQSQNFQTFKISQDSFMMSNASISKRKQHKPIFSCQNATSERLTPHNLQIESRISESERQIIQFQNGDTFEGFVTYSGQLQGEGVYTMKNGSVYRGVFREGKVHGVGTYHGTDGFHYQGQWVDNAPHGYGKATYHDQSSYAGYFKRGKRHGKGFFSKGNSSYNGDFVENRMEGYGVYQTQAQIYQGEWLNNMKHGKGLHKMANGDIYEGEFEFDKKQGYGVMRYSNQSYYSGFWSNGKIEKRRRKARIEETNAVRILQAHKKIL